MAMRVNNSNMYEAIQVISERGFDGMGDAHLSSEHLRRAAERVQNRIYHQPKMEMNYCGVV